MTESSLLPRRYYRLIPPLRLLVILRRYGSQSGLYLQSERASPISFGDALIVVSNLKKQSSCTSSSISTTDCDMCYYALYISKRTAYWKTSCDAEVCSLKRSQVIVSKTHLSARIDNNTTILCLVGTELLLRSLSCYFNWREISVRSDISKSGLLEYT